MSGLSLFFVYFVCRFPQYMAAVHHENLLWRSAGCIFTILGPSYHKGEAGGLQLNESLLGDRPCVMSDRMFLSNSLLPLQQVSFCRDSLSPP